MTIRDYTEADEPSCLRCRALGFLDTSYFDDVVRVKPTYESPSVELVAVTSLSVHGLIDVVVDDDAATIETVAVHPDAARRGLGSRLLEAAIDRLPGNVTTLDAWTRDDPAANAWYQRNGFRETFRYLHVYASDSTEAAMAVRDARPDLTLVAGFFHAEIEQERALRTEFSRVHVCRRYERRLPGKGRAPGLAPAHAERWIWSAAGRG